MSAITSATSASFTSLLTEQSRLILGIMEMITEKLGEQKHAQKKHGLPEISNFGRSRLLKDGASVGNVNNKDYTFNCT